jgi:protein O-GlcNAc transferase
VLSSEPNTVLWLLDDTGGDAAVRKNLAGAAENAGVSADRLIFAEPVDRLQHLQRLRLADVFVDSQLYTAHTVGCDALWSGVPLVTVQGTSMAAR